MAKNVFNWTFTDVEKFLKEHEFSHTHTKGSHYYYTGFYGGQPRIVQVPRHSSKSFKPKTLNGMIRQSGISRDIWLK
jgi:predicted RNA binding protein YcfA (HicA-like mRNA interferase family)